MNNPQSLTVDSTETSDFWAILWTVIILVLIFAYGEFEEWLNDLERRHDRAERLDAYRRRHAWKNSDMRNLLSLDVGVPAKNRMKRLVGTGRPVVKPHRPFVQEVADKLSAVKALLDPDTSVEKRRKAFKQWPWWPHFVEALYRGEYALAKDRRVRGASAETEIKNQSVDSVLGR